MENKSTFLRTLNRQIKVWMAVFLLCICGRAMAQVRVTGTVTDSQGEPITGASVVEKNNTGNGTLTDIDGKFALNITNQDAAVIISYIGYRTEQVSFRDRKDINVTMTEDTQALDEVVVVGYGSVKKSNLTTSVSKITSDAIDGRPVTSLSDALSGQLAGLQTQTSSGLPGEEMQITVRGTSSINGSSTPLIVVDGVITDDMNGVNPSDVASIQVLKDAAATSIYGARGSAGVILIETKEAREGAPSVRWESYVGLQDAVGMPEMMTPREWMAYNVWIKNAMWLQKDRKNSLDTPNMSRPSGDRVNTNWLANPNATVGDYTLRDDLPQTDWTDEIMRTALTHNHQVSLTSKGDRYSLYVSAGYLNQEGIVKYTDFEKFNFRINATMQLNKRLSAGVKFAPSVSTQNRGESEGKDKTIMSALSTVPIIGMDEGTRTMGFSKFRSTDVNPYERLRQVTDKRKIKSYDIAAWIDVNIIKGMVFKSMFNYASNDRTDEYFLPLDVQKPSVSSAVATTSFVNSARTGWQNTLTYDLRLGKIHELSILLGQSIENRNILTSNLAASNFPLDNVTTLNQGSTPTKASTLRNIVRTSSLFARVNYNIADRYLLSASVRRDGSSRFGKSNRWGTFPSVSAGWKMSSEQFMRDITAINLLKLRASWGMSGNDRIGYSDYLSTFNAGNTVYNNNTAISIYPSNYSNPSLKWETTKALDFGFDLSLLNNRLQLNVDYYINRTDDLLYSLQLPAPAGFATTKTNLASLENRGWELDLTTTNIRTKKFTWTSTLNLSSNTNKVLDLGGNDNIITDAWEHHSSLRSEAPSHNSTHTALTDF